jgi:hypothetical protein
MLIDLKTPVQKSGDLRLLNTIVSALVGQPFLKAGYTYPESLVLHLGNPVPYTDPKKTVKTKGAWRLKVAASSWQVFLSEPGAIISYQTVPVSSPSPSAVPIDKEATAAKVTASLGGKTVLAANPLLLPESVWKAEGIGALLRFEDGSTVIVWPSQEPDAADIEGEPVPDWELFTSFNMYLRVGPGAEWSYRGANVPDSVASSHNGVIATSS